MKENTLLSIFPVPRKIKVTDHEAAPFVPRGFCCESADCDSTDSEIVHTWRQAEGFALGKGTQTLQLRLHRKRERETLYVEDNSQLSEEKYRLNITTGVKTGKADITFGHPRGLKHALATIAMLARNGGFTSCTIEDYPGFAIRGIIEGFYGHPWNHDDRIDMFHLLSEYKMNTYVYGPKDDPYHRQLWRKPYDSKALMKLSQLYEAASKCGLDFYYSLGPGLSMRYSDKTDIDALEAKLLQVREIGIMHFGLFLDDIPPILQFSRDTRQFKDLVDAHIALTQRLFNRLKEHDPGIRFIVCPTQYHGAGNEYYISRLGSELHPLIDILWTGPEICSGKLTLRDAAVFAQSTLHMPLYWDNYPVNDLEMSNEMHIGPYLNRDKDLNRFSRGIIANGMEYPEASKIPFITISCYTWNPGAYDPEICLKHAIQRIAGLRDAEDFLVFADNIRYSCLFPADSPKLSRLLEK
ncbi:MAG: protein O-GlcNAcase, partial [Spirochaetota bacterium]